MKGRVCFAIAALVVSQLLTGAGIKSISEANDSNSPRDMAFLPYYYFCRTHLTEGIHGKKEYLSIMSESPTQGSRNVEKYVLQGEKYLSDEKYDEAIRSFNNALSLDEYAVDAYIGKATACMYRSEDEVSLSIAFSELDKAYQLDSTNEEVFLALADLYIRMNQIEAADDVLRQGLEEASTCERINEKIESIDSSEKYICTSGHKHCERILNQDGSVLLYVTYAENPSRNIRSILKYDADWKMTSGSVSQFDDLGRLICDLSCDENGIINIYRTHEYVGDTDKISKETKYHPQEDIISRQTVYEYDSDGNLVKEKAYRIFNNELLYEKTY